MQDRLYSVKSACEFYGGDISPWTIYAWLSQGKIQRTKVGSRTFIRESELVKMIHEGGKSPAAPRKQKDARQW